MSYMTMGDEIHALRCDRAAILAELEAVKHQKAQLREALELVLRRGDLVKRSDQYMFEVLDAARAALNSMEEE